MQKNALIHSGHITPLKIYLVVGAALIFLTAVTVAVSFIRLGGWNVVVALIIASIKALLVAFFFMHLIYDNKLYLIVLSAAVAFLAILIILTMFDTMERDRIYQIKAGPINKNAIIYERHTSDSLANPNHSQPTDSSADEVH